MTLCQLHLLLHVGTPRAVESDSARAKDTVTARSGSRVFTCEISIEKLASAFFEVFALTFGLGQSHGSVVDLVGEPLVDIPDLYLPVFSLFGDMLMLLRIGCCMNSLNGKPRVHKLSHHLLIVCHLFVI